MDLPRISIVTPSLNQVEYLDATLASVINQGYPELEYIVVDGGSTDGSVGLIERHQEGISHWASEPDSGHANAINKGFARTTGEIMGWINSSDIYFPWTLRTVAEVFRDLPGVEWITGVSTALDVGASPKFVAVSPCNRYDLLVDRIPRIQQESVFWRRSLWGRTGGGLDESLRLACDFELWLRMSRHAPLYHISTILAAFRYHGDARGSSMREEYDQELKGVQKAEISGLASRDRARIHVLKSVGHLGGRGGLSLLERARVLPWYRHARVAYDFASRRWRIL